MALINCPDCGTKVSDMAISCPNCARPIATIGSVEIDTEAKSHLEPEIHNDSDDHPVAIRLSKRFFVGTFIGVIPFFVMILLIMKFARLTLPKIVISGIPILILIYIIIIKSIVVYKMWAAIQDGYASTSPGKALGFLYIPYFNLYWVFRAFWGFAKDYNTLISRRSIKVPNTAAGLYLTYAILSVALFVFPSIMRRPGMETPVFISSMKYIVLITWYIVSTLMISKICDAVNSIPIDKIKEIQDGKAMVARHPHLKEVSPEVDEDKGEAFEEEKPIKKPLLDIKKELRSWGIGLIVLGVAHLFLKALEPIWGVIIIVIGLFNLLLIRRGMFIVNGIALLLVGILNLVAGAEAKSGWAAFGILQVIWGVQEIRKFKRYKSNRSICGE